MKTISTNKKALFDYEIIEKFEAGISLLGAEVKSIASGKISLKESFISVSDKKAIWKQGHITIPESIVFDRPSETRERQLLLNKKEINRLIGAVSKEGLTVIPLSIYQADNGKLKLEIALAKGKKLFDKREDLKQKDLNRDMQIALKELK